MHIVSFCHIVHSSKLKWDASRSDDLQMRILIKDMGPGKRKNAKSETAFVDLFAKEKVSRKVHVREYLPSTCKLFLRTSLSQFQFFVAENTFWYIYQGPELLSVRNEKWQQFARRSGLAFKRADVQSSIRQIL